jgi:hypothetical protein
LEKSNNHQFFEDFEITRTDGSFSDFDFCQSTGTQKLFSISGNNLKDQNRRLLAESNGHPTLWCFLWPKLSFVSKLYVLLRT